MVQSRVIVLVLALALSACAGQSSPVVPQGGVHQGLPTSKYAIPSSVSYNSIYSFGATSKDGYGPYAGIVAVKGVLYGTTASGGNNGFNGGTVYSITPGGVESVLHNFGSGTDGYAPNSDPVGLKGVLYGTTFSGGTHNFGTVYSLTTSGTEKVLHSFSNGSDGNAPIAPLIAVNGVLYGTTYGGGPNNAGTIFKITKAGNEKVLYAFGSSGPSDGVNPRGSLINVGGVLFGTTQNGGSGGVGTVYSVTTKGTEIVLYSFSGGSDGINTYGGLVAIKGVLYGTTYGGGTNGAGVVFSITTAGSEHVLHSFGSGSDGKNPWAGLAVRQGVLYGTSKYGGAFGSTNYGGTVFKITTSGTEHVLHSFGSGSDGADPIDALTNVNGTLYGTTFVGGTNSFGTVFSLTP